MATARQMIVGFAIAAAVTVTLATLAMVVLGIFCPPLVIPMAAAFFKFAAVFFAAAALVMLSMELLKVVNFATSKTTPNPVAAPPAPTN